MVAITAEDVVELEGVTGGDREAREIIVCVVVPAKRVLSG